MRTALRLILFAALFAGLAGCGKKGPVRPLSKPLPAAAAKLSARQVGMRLLLAWNLPQVNQNGTPLTDLEGFRLYKMDYDLDDDCPDCRDTSVLLDELDLDYLENARREGERLFYWDAELRPGTGYQYRVVPVTRSKRLGAPATVRAPFSVPPLAPAALRASGHDRLVRLSWEEAPAEDGLGYNVYRRLPDEPFAGTPLNKAPLSATAFEDYRVENGGRYVYAVRSLAPRRDRSVESVLSASAEAQPQEGL